MSKVIIFVIAVWGSLAFARFTPPDATQTPGALCTPKNPDFKGHDYPERVARCNRNVNREDKLQIAARYGDLPPSEWPKYEFDHLLPLCAGGSNELTNVWPQPLDQARSKDQLENDVCIAMQSGKMTQAQAIQAMRDWFTGMNQKVGTDGISDIYCRAKDGTIIRFDVVEKGWIAHIFVNLEDADREHEALHIEGSVAGHPRSLDTHGEKPTMVFTLEGGILGDIFELHLPIANLTKKGKSFYGRLRRGSGDQAQNTMRLHCAH